MFSNKCFSCPCKTKPPRVFPTGDGKAHCPPPQRRNPLRNRKSKEGFFPCYPQEMHHLWKVPFASRGGPPKGSRGRAESPLVASAEAKPSEKQEKARKAFFLAIHRICITCGKSHLLQEVGPRRGPGGERKAPWSPPQRRNPLRSRKSKIGSFLCHPQGICVLWEVSSACGRTRYFPTRESTQRVPGAAKGCMSRGRPRTPRC